MKDPIKAFESWLPTEYDVCYLSRRDGGGYYNLDADIAWSGWAACSRLASNKLSTAHRAIEVIYNEALFASKRGEPVNLEVILVEARHALAVIEDKNTGEEDI